MDISLVKIDEEGRPYIERKRKIHPFYIKREYGEIRKCRECKIKFFAENRKIEVGGGKYCSNKCQTHLSNHPRWNGGRFKSKYIYIDNPDNSKPHGRLHRILMEQKLGRTLTYDECIHHVDGNKNNNDISNLTIMTRSEHTRLHAQERRNKNVNV